MLGKREKAKETIPAPVRHKVNPCSTGFEKLSRQPPYINLPQTAFAFLFRNVGILRHELLKLSGGPRSAIHLADKGASASLSASFTAFFFAGNSLHGFYFHAARQKKQFSFFPHTALSAGISCKAQVKNIRFHSLKEANRQRPAK